MSDHLLSNLILGLAVLLVSLLAGLALGSFAAAIVVGGFALVGAGVLIDSRDRGRTHGPHNLAGRR